MIKRIFEEQKSKFEVFTLSARKLIWSNLLFGLFNPFYFIFSNTFIFKHSNGNLVYNLIYCSFTFSGIISGFVINGFLLKKFHVRNQLIFGELMLFISITTLFLVPGNFLTDVSVSCFGLIAGIGSGIYWSSRNYLTIVNTTDSNRDFFAGLDYILISGGRIITPFLVGIYIGEGTKHGLFSSSFAYSSTLIFAFLAILFSSLMVIKEKYKTTQTKKFVFIRYNKEWSNSRLLITLLGFFQGAIFVIPPVFIMKYIGNEATVGTLNSVSYIVAITIVYVISSRSKTEHRTGIIIAAASILLTGALIYSFFISSQSILATSILMFLMFIAEPIINFPCRATVMKAIDDLKHLENRDDYAYLLDIEFFAAVGRVASMILFYVLYTSFETGIALSVYVVFIALLQFFNVPLSKRINGN
jgi:MFS transporter, YQGE family, putative transporter